MTRLQELRETISTLQKRYARLRADKDVLERVWSPDVKAGIPAIQEEMNEVLKQLRETEAEEHRIAWPRLRKKQ